MLGKPLPAEFLLAVQLLKAWRPCRWQIKSENAIRYFYELARDQHDLCLCAYGGWISLNSKHFLSKLENEMYFDCK